MSRLNCDRNYHSRGEGFEKGFCLDTGTVLPSVLNEDVCLPSLTINRQKLLMNIKWMQDFADAYQVNLAPHGKTSMTPEIFRLQHQAGAWGLTVANPIQAHTAYSAGISRIIMANQLVGKANCELVSALLLNADVEFYCVIDSEENAHYLNAFFEQKQQTLNVLIELGVEHGRCGCRTDHQFYQLLDTIKDLPQLNLSGIEFYEGVIHSDDAEKDVRSFIQQAIGKFQSQPFQSLLGKRSAIFSGAGSAWYDVVSDEIEKANFSESVVPIIRPGCYVTHDLGIYEQAQQQVLQRNSKASCISGELSSCLELWAYVQSIPEPGAAIIGFGKRDAAFDAGLPKPVRHYVPGSAHPKNAPEDWKITEVMDQHAFMTFSGPLNVGDIISFGTSHPCLTFDKWREINVLDEDFNVVEKYHTFF